MAHMRVATRLMLLGAAVVLAGCVLGVGPPETRGTTRTMYAGAVPVMLTNATPDRMCGFYMTDDAEFEYGDNWLAEGGLPSGSSITFRVRPGKYKVRWDTCKDGEARPYFAATLWRESAVTVSQQIQLYAYVADSVAPTRRAQVMGRDYQVVRFPGQAIDPGTRPRPGPREPQVAVRAADEPPQIGGYIGRVPLSAEIVAQLTSPPEAASGDKLDARELVDRKR